MSLHFHPLPDALIVGIEYPEKGPDGRDGFRTATIVIPDRALRNDGPTKAAGRVTLAFINAGFGGEDVRHKLEGEFRKRLQSRSGGLRDGRDS